MTIKKGDNSGIFKPPFAIEETRMKTVAKGDKIKVVEIAC